MGKFFGFLFKNKVAVLLLCALAAVFSAFGMVKTAINPDVASYLTDDTVSRKTMDILSRYFDVHGDASIVIEGDAGDYPALKELAGRLGGVKDVGAVLWLGSYDALFAFSEGNRFRQPDYTR